MSSINPKVLPPRRIHGTYRAAGFAVWGAGYRAIGAMRVPEEDVFPPARDPEKHRAPGPRRTPATHDSKAADLAVCSPPIGP